MGCCLSKKSPPSVSLPNGSSCVVESPDPNKPKKPVPENPAVEEVKPITIISEKLHQEEDGTTKEVSVIKHRRSHEESAAVEKSVVMSSSCTKEEEVDAILIQCGKLSRSNSAAKTRRYSGSKRSFDFDQNERIHAGDVEEQEAQRKTHPVNNSPRERRRRTPSREREDSKSYRSGSRERGNGGSRRVSRSPGKRSETNPNSNSSNIRPGKFVTVPATEKSNNGEPSIKRITVKRNIGEACRTAASPRSKSPSLSRSSSRKAEQSPYRRNPLGEIDQNSIRIGSCNNKKIINRENETGKPNPRKTIRASSPQVISRSRSLRKSRDFDFSPETLLLSNEENKNNNYTALLLKDIQSFHGKSNADDPFNLLPSCVSKACSIVEAVADLNSATTTNTCFSSDLNQFRFTSTAKKADLMEPSFEKYVTVKRGGSLEGQESSGSNNLT
ncbi:hypothetical protein AALP_AA2G074300 [Arabis alpina]|uniref:Uncharacterized protein n=1 Tax=Arabis alpina TaxID=50452 RepID=A0A087HFW4_ARAAL|nr:hypothetical protein AALP_AA2G074300 [Arabis alpina]